MPCRGPCAVAKDGTTHQDYGNKENPTCHLDEGHNGPHSWEPEFQRQAARRLQEAELSRAENVYGSGSITMRQLLCAACRVLTRYGYDFDENPALSQWWEKHQKVEVTDE